MWQGMLQTLAPVAGGALALYVHHARRTDLSEDVPWTHTLGRNGVMVVGAIAVMMWSVP